MTKVMTKNQFQELVDGLDTIFSHLGLRMPALRQIAKLSGCSWGQFNLMYNGKRPLDTPKALDTIKALTLFRDGDVEYKQEQLKDIETRSIGKPLSAEASEFTSQCQKMKFNDSRHIAMALGASKTLVDYILRGDQEPSSYILQSLRFLEAMPADTRKVWINRAKDVDKREEVLEEDTRELLDQALELLDGNKATLARALKVQQPVLNRYFGPRSVPLYIGVSACFFLHLTDRSREKFLKAP